MAGSLVEQRKFGLRRDINDLVRDESGNISGSKIGTYVGQYIAAHILLIHSEDLIDHWDSMTVLFLVLIAPEAYKRLLAMRWGSTTTERTERSVTTTKETK